jgi:hypothetical protein
VVRFKERERLGGVLGIARRTEEERVEEGLEVESSMGARGWEQKERKGSDREERAGENGWGEKKLRILQLTED